MARTAILPGGTYAAGVRQFTPSIPTDATWVKVGMDCASQTNPAQGLTVRVELSLDGGVVWADHIAFARPGGTQFPAARNGLPGTEIFGKWYLPEPGNPNRQARITVTTTGPSVTTTGGFIETD